MGFDTLAAALLQLAADWLTLNSVVFHTWKIEPDSLVVVRLGPDRTLLDGSRIGRALAHVLPVGAKPLVLGDGFDIEVLNEEQLRALGLWRIPPLVELRH